MAREQFQTLTEPMYYILIALSEECCGVDIMEKVQKISGGRVKVGQGTLYTMLSKFEENQIIFRTKEEGRRKSYVITEPVSYTHLTLPTNSIVCRSRWSPYH